MNTVLPPGYLSKNPSRVPPRIPPGTSQLATKANPLPHSRLPQECFVNTRLLQLPMLFFSVIRK